jgi:hypothetical protein
MRRLIPLLALILTAGTAHAGGYLGLGIHSEAGLGGDMNDNFSSTGHNGGRLTLGTRISRIAIEGTLDGTDISSTNGFGERRDYSLVSAGIGGKYFVPLAAGGAFEAFGKFGLQRSWLRGDGDARIDHSGDGWAAGAGLQYSFNVGLVGGAALLVDYTYQKLDMKDSGRADLIGNVRTLSAGFQLGF